MAQDETLCFHIVEEFDTKDLPNESNIHAWNSINNKFYPKERASKTRLWKKFEKIELYDVTTESEEWITELELLKGYLRKLGLIIDDVELSNLPVI